MYQGALAVSSLMPLVPALDLANAASTVCHMSVMYFSGAPRCL